MPEPRDETADALDEIALLHRKLDRERHARQEAERLLEDKSRLLWEANAALTDAVVRLQELSERDPLTGLSNRRALDEWLERRRACQPRTGDWIGVLAIDVDHFKTINDTHGHDVGDQVLRALARRIGGVVRADDLVVRQGGDEILVVLAGVRDGANSHAVGEKVLEAATAPLELGGITLVPSLSIGAAAMPPDGDLQETIRSADRALYRAKEAGRGIVASATD
jgi:diguanylate cyclase (GGDEF)-like protein